MPCELSVQDRVLWKDMIQDCPACTLLIVGRIACILSLLECHGLLSCQEDDAVTTSSSVCSADQKCTMPASLLQLDCMCAGSLVTEVGLRRKQSGTISHSAFTVVSPADVLSVLAASPEGANAIAGISTGL